MPLLGDDHTFASVIVESAIDPVRLCHDKHFAKQAKVEVNRLSYTHVSSNTCSDKDNRKKRTSSISFIL